MEEKERGKRVGKEEREGMEKVEFKLWVFNFSILLYDVVFIVILGLFFIRCFINVV